MTDETHGRNIALLIDADNASSSTLDPVLTILAELGTVNIRRVYGNWSKPALKGWRFSRPWKSTSPIKWRLSRFMAAPLALRTNLATDVGRGKRRYV